MGLLDVIIKSTKDQIKLKTREAGNDFIDRIKDTTTQFVHDNIEKGRSTIINKINNKDGEINSRSEKEQLAKRADTPATQNGKLHINMTHEEENAFLETLPKRITKAAIAAKSGNPMDIINAITEVSTVVADAVKFCEIQETKRKEIDSQRQQALAFIDAQKQILIVYLERTFDERKSIFIQHFKVVDNALATGNIDVLMLGLNNINSLAASSPFKNLQNVQEALKNKNTIWEL